MIRKTFCASAVAVLCAGVAVGAQSTAGAGQGQNPTGATGTAAQAGTTTLTGCVYNEKDVPGRTPNIAERAGVMEDYILADVKMSGSSATTGTSGASFVPGRMYKLEHVDDERLKAMVGKRVEVTGKIDAEAGDTGSRPAGTSGADKSPGPDRIELSEFEVSSIKEISGSCPSKPSAK